MLNWLPLHLCLNVDNTFDKYTHSVENHLCQVRILKYFLPLQVMSVSTNTTPLLHWAILVSFPHLYHPLPHLLTVLVLPGGIHLLLANLSHPSPSLNNSKPTILFSRDQGTKDRHWLYFAILDDSQWSETAELRQCMHLHHNIYQNSNNHRK